MRKAKLVAARLTQKFGFAEQPQHHMYYVLEVDGTVAARTHMSHGETDIDDFLPGKMARQCHVSGPQFQRTIDGTMSNAQYRARLEQL